MPKPTAKKSPVPAKTTKQDVTESNVDVSLMLRQDAGKGVSTSTEDNIIPLLYILQAQSPQCLKQKPEYIKGATAGNIWPRGSSILIDGEEEGLPVVPCGMRKWWIEWRPDRAGFVARHEYVESESNKGRPVDAVNNIDPKTGIPQWTRSNGNLLVETREHAVLAYIEDQWSPYVVAMSGSNHVASKQWNGEMLRKRLPPPNDDIIPAGYAFVYNMKTLPASNEFGDWYKWVIENGTGDGAKTETLKVDGGIDLYRSARALHDAFMSGAKSAEHPVSDSPSSEDAPF